MMIRKAALQVGAPALLVFMAWNAYLAVNHLKQIQNIAALTLESSKIRADISSILKDLTDMETGQRGYLLTADPSYLQPYNDAKSRIRADFDRLSAGLVNRTERERSLSLELPRGPGALPDRSEPGHAGREQAGRGHLRGLRRGREQGHRGMRGRAGSRVLARAKRPWPPGAFE